MTTTHDPALGRIESQIGESTARLRYRREGSRLLILYVEVPAEHRGRGIGAELVEEAMKLARAENLEVIPVCSFAAAYLRRKG